MERLEKLEHTLGYTFKNKDLLDKALHHSSYANRNTKKKDNLSNERLEFLGDRVLGLAMAEYLYNSFPNENEGVLSGCIAYLNSSHVLNTIAGTLELEKYIYIHDVSIKTLANKIFANALEAILAAIYLDSDFTTAKTIIIKLWQPYVNSSLSHNIKLQFNPKSLLQEWAHKNNLNAPVYHDFKKEGSEHEPVFFVKLEIPGFKGVVASSSSKKNAQKKAAQEFIKINNLWKQNP